MLEYAELFGVLVIIKQGFPSSFLNSQFFKSSALTFIDIIKKIAKKILNNIYNNLL